jgi:hypothetical protein
MSQTSITASSQAAASPAGVQAAPAATAKPRSRKGLARWVLEALASLKLTVVLLALSIVLVFCGTLAQVDHGIWVVVKTYFRSFFVWIPLLIFFPRSVSNPLPWYIGFPFPGGWTIGALLLVNLFAAHLVRFKISWKRSGILLIHAGLIVLMLSELITGLFAVEGNMSIATGGSSNFIERTEHMELAVVAPVDKQNEEVTSVPASILRKGGQISHASLPFDVRVVQYMPNTKDLVAPSVAGVANLATTGTGLRFVALEQPEGVGVDSDQKFDAPSAYLELKAKDTGESLGVYLVSALMPNPQTVDVGAKKYDIALRPHHDYKPYSMQLLDFTHKVYPGTNIPKDFRSRVRLTDKGNNEDREVEIYMNAPLRYEGETFYQVGVVGRDEGTVLQVVRNPGWQLPYIACTMVIVGLVVHFGINLTGFLRRVLS